MAHELSINNGRAEMFYFGAKPWHELGTEVPSALTSEEAIVAAGLNWQVKKAPVEFTTPEGQMVSVDGKYVNYREDNNTPLGVVGRDYTIVQNKDAFKFFDAVVGEKAAMYHTAGALFSGRKIWMLAKLPQDTIVKGVDISKNYLLLCNSHDGTGALQTFFTSVRAVCNNTVSMAITEAKGNISYLRHTTNIGMRVKQVQTFLGLTNGLINRFNLKANELADMKLTSLVVEEFMTRMGLRVAEGEDASTKKENIEAAIMTALDKTNRETPQIADTRWALLNAYTDYVDHDKTVKPSNDQDKWADSILFGSGAEAKRKALGALVTI